MKRVVYPLKPPILPPQNFKIPTLNFENPLFYPYLPSKKALTSLLLGYKICLNLLRKKAVNPIKISFHIELYTFLIKINSRTK